MIPLRANIHLQLVFDHLYKAESLREVGTLKYFRERVNRKSITPDKVTKSFEGTEDFFVSNGTGYILEAAMEFDDVLGSFVNEFVMADPVQDAMMENQKLQRILDRYHLSSLWLVLWG